MRNLFVLSADTVRLRDMFSTGALMALGATWQGVRSLADSNTQTRSVFFCDERSQAIHGL